MSSSALYRISARNIKLDWERRSVEATVLAGASGNVAVENSGQELDCCSIDPRRAGRTALYRWRMADTRVVLFSSSAGGAVDVSVLLIDPRRVGRWALVTESTFTVNSPSKEVLRWTPRVRCGRLPPLRRGCCGRPGTWSNGSDRERARTRRFPSLKFGSFLLKSSCSDLERQSLLDKCRM